MGEPLYPPEVRAFAISELLAGRSVRQVRRTLTERYEITPGLATIHQWLMAEGPDVVREWANAKFAASAAMHLQIAEMAGERLMEKLELEEDTYKLNAVYGTASDKVQRLAQLAQDQRRDNELREALRHALTLDTETRRKMLAPILDETGP